MKNNLTQRTLCGGSNNIEMLSILVALEFLMSFTFLGYVHVPPITITFAYVPVLISACFLGPVQSTLIGFLFGLASMYKASAYYVQPFDRIFSPFTSGTPLPSFLLSVGTRTLFGLILGLLFCWLRKQKNRNFLFGAGVISMLTPKMHAILVFGGMGLLFPDLGYTVKNALRLDRNDVLVSLLCVVVIMALWKITHMEICKNFYTFIRLSEKNVHDMERSKRLPWEMFLITVLIAMVASTFYFAQRITYMLNRYGIELSDKMRVDLLHLQIQFVMAMMSLSFIVLVFLIMIYRYINYKKYLEQLDGLTGIMGRKMFFEHCKTRLRDRRLNFGQEGWFLLLDVDYFKTINDTYGHPTGDVVLKEVAESLQHTFKDCGAVGRIGGDEFSAMLASDISVQEVKRRLNEFLKTISGILPDTKVTCSIGACRFEHAKDLQTIYTETDHLLYSAKENGRACYVIGSFEGNKS